ncbi:UNVERIFIED_CONTAM: hypothetical protein Slati_1460000, partial [Sesamum latifolium]
TDEELKQMSDIPYASAVGSIQYVVQCTGPDVAYALSVMSKYQVCAGEAHWSAIKTILKGAAIAQPVRRRLALDLGDYPPKKWCLLHLSDDDAPLGDNQPDLGDIAIAQLVTTTCSSYLMIRQR